MFGSIGGTEMLVLFLIGLLVFGPRRLPEIGQKLGKMLVEFRKAATDLRTSIEREVNLDEVRQAGESLQRTVQNELNRQIEPLIAPVREALPRLSTDLAALEEPKESPSPDKPAGPDDVVRAG